MRPTTLADVDAFFEHQCDELASQQAAFTSNSPRDRSACDAHWSRILSDPTVTSRTVTIAGQVLGHVAAFVRDGQNEVTFWFGREHWGRGVATRALRAFLDEFGARPVWARAASDNMGSLHVLEKCGFRVEGHERAFANARRKAIEETILILR